MELTIFEISYQNPDPKKGWMKLRIAATTLKEAVDEAVQQGVAQEVMTNIQNTRQTLDGCVLPVIPAAATAVGTELVPAES